MVSRRGFLQMLGAGAVVAATPGWLPGAVAAPDLPHYTGKWLAFDCAGLTPGVTYTFSASVKGRRDGKSRGLAVYGIKATGGETKVRIPLEVGGDECDMHQVCLSHEGITVPPLYNGKLDFTRAGLPSGIQRGTNIVHTYGPRTRWGAPK